MSKEKAIELLEEAANEAGDVDIQEWPAHNQKCQNLINQALAELQKQPEPKCKICGDSGEVLPKEIYKYGEPAGRSSMAKIDCPKCKLKPTELAKHLRVCARFAKEQDPTFTLKTNAYELEKAAAELDTLAAAKKAARTGNHKDLHNYLRLRRKR